MKTKKRIMMFLLVVLTLGILTACGSESNEQVADDGEASPDTSDTTENTEPAPQVEITEPITIQYWHAHGDTQIDALNEMIDRFHAEHPNITIEPIFQGGYGDNHKKLMAARAANTVPAVSVIENASIPNFTESGMLADLTPFIERDGIDLGDFSEGMLKAYHYDGKQTGLPLIVSASVMIYNKDLFDEAGVEPPQTWDEIEAFAEKLTVKDGDTVSRYAFAVPGWSAWYYDPWIINGGGEILTEDGTSGIALEESKKFLKNFQEWKEKGYLYLPYGQGASGTMRQMFFDQEIAMIEHTSSLIDWYLENVDFEVGVSFLPGDKNRVTHIGGGGIVMLDAISDEEKEAAWQFIKFMTSSEHNIFWADNTGYLPTRKSALEASDGQQFLEENPAYRAILEWFDNVNPRVQHPAYGEFRAFYEEVVGIIALEGGDVDALLEEASKNIDAVLADY